MHVQIIKCTTPSVNLNLNNGLWVIMIYKCGLSVVMCIVYHPDGKYCKGRDFACKGTEDRWGIYVHSYLFCCEPKIV